MEAIINQERVRARVSEYIANRGYVKERTFTFGRLGIHEASPHPWDNIMTFANLYTLSEPVREVYQQGRDLYAKASVLTPRYKEISEINDYHERALREECEENPGFLRIKRLGYRFIRFVGNPLLTPLPPKVSDEEGRQSLCKLYSMLQEDQEGTPLLSVYPSVFEVMFYEIKRDLFKIKNHTSIVCLDQLQKDDLKLDEGVSAELGRIPQEYLKDFGFHGLKGTNIGFGNGLF